MKSIEAFNPILHELNPDDKLRRCATCGNPSKDFYDRKQVKNGKEYMILSSDCKKCFKRKVVEARRNKRLAA